MALRAGLLSPAPVLLQWPIRCELGTTCWVQNYLDHEPGEGARDFACGALPYDGHDGTDLRVRDLPAMRAGVDVLAVASGTVRATRDGEPERLLADGEHAPAGKECGNGVVLTYPDAWETQYCHLAAGSIAVREGQRVQAGDVLGRVGLSGDTQFPHVHLTVKHNGVPVDPFDSGDRGDCDGTDPLWDPPGEYRRSDVLGIGFADAPPAFPSDVPLPTPASDALVGWVYAIGLHAGDVQSLRVLDPTGAVFAETSRPPLEHAKATASLYAGKRDRSGLAPGVWTVRYTVTHDGETVLDRVAEWTHAEQVQP